MSTTVAQHSGQLNDAITQLSGASTGLVNLLVPNLQPLEADAGTIPALDLEDPGEPSAERLIELRYTDQAHLAVTGTSAGGVMAPPAVPLTGAPFCDSAAPAGRTSDTRCSASEAKVG